MKSTDRKILFFDIDGTLITEDGRRYFPDSARRALAQARANGHLVFINTGRVYCNVTDEIKDAGFDGFVCGCGTSIYYDGKELFHNDVSRDVCRDIAYACRRYDMFGMYEHRDGQMEYLLGRMWTRMTLNSTSSAAGSRMTIKMFLSSASMYHSILTISTEVQISAR